MILVKDLMTAGPMTVQSSESLKDAMELMQWRRIRHLPVVNSDGELVGLVSHRDCLNLSFSELAEVSQEDAEEIYETIPLNEVMHRHLITATPYQPLKEAARLLFENKIGCLPIIDSNNHLVGILTESDFVRVVAQWPLEAVEAFESEKVDRRQGQQIPIVG